LQTNTPGQANTPKFLGRVSGLQKAYSGCPLCAGAGVTLGFANCTKHPLWHEPLPPTITWLRCASCGHVHNQSYWTEAGLTELRRNEPADALAQSSAKLQARRVAWAPLVDKVVGLLGGYRTVLNRETRPIWVDVGCGDGTLIMTAVDSGIAAIGLETHAAAVTRIQGLVSHAASRLRTAEIRSHAGRAVDDGCAGATSLSARGAAQSGAGVASGRRVGRQHRRTWPPRAGESWRRRRSIPTGRTSSACTTSAASNSWPCLRDTGFEIADFAIADRARAQMEIYAVRKS